MYSIRFSYKLKLKSLFLIMLLVVTFLPSGLIYKSEYFQTILQVSYIIQFVFYSGTVLYLYNRKQLCKEWLYRAILIYGFFLMLTTLYHLKSISMALKGFTFILGIYVIFQLLHSIDYLNDKRAFVTLTKGFVIFSAINYIIPFIFPDGLYNNSWQGGTYWFGGKFSTFYMFYIGGCIYFIKNKKDSLFKFIVFFILGLILCMRTDCSTGIICLCFTLVFYIFKNALSKLHPLIILASIIGITFVLITTDFILNANIIQNIIVNVFKKTSDLTGRMDIYASFSEIISGYFWFGAGYSNSIVAQRTTRGYLNAQNGLLDVMTQTGIVGVIFILIIILLAWRKGYNYIENYENQMTVVFLLGFIVCSSVEPVFNNYFYLLLSLFTTNLAQLKYGKIREQRGIKNEDFTIGLRMQS